ncbi:MAG: hypothetical protein AABZ15_02450 [Nitrospirota bacterium]|mgnify:CR=1 FL=1
MRKFIAFFVIVTVSAGMAMASSRPVISPKSEYRQIGAVVSSPSETGWSLVQANNLGVAFGRQYSSAEETAIVKTTIFKVEGFDDDKEYLNYIASQREKQDDKKRFKILSITNEQVSFKGTACLKYRGLSEDHKSKGIDSTDFQYLKTAGYICRHPASKSIAFQMEISQRSQEKAFLQEFISLGEEFFNNIQFTDAGLK